MFVKLKKEFAECEADESDKAIRVLHTNLQKALDRKHVALSRLSEVSHKLSDELKTYRANLKNNPNETHSCEIVNNNTASRASKEFAFKQKREEEDKDNPSSHPTSIAQPATPHLLEAINCPEGDNRQR